MWGFLDHRDNYSGGTWSPNFMKFFMVGNFLGYFMKMKSLRPSNLEAVSKEQQFEPKQLKPFYGKNLP